MSSENPRVGGSIDGTAAALPRLRRLSTGSADLGADRLVVDPHPCGAHSVRPDSLCESVRPWPPSSSVLTSDKIQAIA